MVNNLKNKKNKSDKSLKIFNFIKGYIDNKGYPPSVREICSGVNLNSTSSVHAHLANLEKQGYIRRDSTKPRTIEILTGKKPGETKDSPSPSPSSSITQNQFECNYNSYSQIPVVGQVTAGEPILAEENIQEYFPLPKDFIRSNTMFMLKIKGDSMINAGIMDDDLVIVSQQATAESGEIIVALLEDEATVKRFYKTRDGGIMLQPENPAHTPIYPDEVSIIGKVVGLFRNLK